MYSQELLNNLFRHPYTRIEYLQNDLDVSRQTAAKYLDTLAEQGFVGVALGVAWLGHGRSLVVLVLF